MVALVITRLGVDKLVTPSSELMVASPTVAVLPAEVAAGSVNGSRAPVLRVLISAPATPTENAPSVVGSLSVDSTPVSIPPPVYKPPGRPPPPPSDIPATRPFCT